MHLLRFAGPSIGLLLLSILTVVGAAPSALAQEPVPTFALPNEEETKKALEAAKDALVEELKLDEHFGPQSRLATKLSQLDGEKLGTFFGSVAGGDANAAFNSIGDIGANYFLNDLKNKWNEVEFEGKGLLGYVPVDAQGCKEALVDLWWHGGEKAAVRIERMLREQSVESLKNISRDAIAHSLDWVLKDTLEKAPGAYFIKLVEAEIWMLQAAERFQDRAILNKLAAAQEFYNERRAANGPSAAFNAVMDRAELYVYSHALAEKHNDLPALFESLYRRTTAGRELVEQMRVKKMRAQALATSKAKADLKAEVERIQQLVRDKLSKMGESDEAIRKLHQANLAVEQKLAQMKKALSLLELNRSQLTIVHSRLDSVSQELPQLLENVKPNPDTGRKSLTELAQATSDASRQVDQWDTVLRGLQDQVRELRSTGRRFSDRVRAFCNSSNASTAALQKEGLALIKEIRQLSVAAETKWQGEFRDALNQLAEIRGYQLQAERMRNQYEPIVRVLTEVERLETSLATFTTSAKDAEKTYDVANASCGNMIRALRKAMGAPQGKRLACEALKREYEIEMEDFRATPGLRSDVNALLDKAEKKLKELGPQILELQQLRKQFRSWLDDASKPLAFDSGKSREQAYELRTQLERYLGGLRTLVRTARQCAHLDPSVVMRADLVEAQRLLKEAQEQGGKLLHRSAELERLKDRVDKEVGILKNLQSRTASLATKLPAALAACAKIEQEQTRPADAEMSSAAARADLEFSKLQQHYQRTASLVGALRGMQDGVSQVKNSAHCENLRASAARTAELANNAADLGHQAATSLSGLFNGKDHEGPVPLASALREAQSALTALQVTLPEASSALSRNTPQTLSADGANAQRLWGVMRQHAHEVSWRVARINSLLQPYLKEWQDARHVQSEAKRAAEIVASHIKQAKSMTASVVEAVPGAINDRANLQRVLPELQAAIGQLRRCCTSGNNLPVTRLLEYDNHAGEWHAKFNSLSVEARNIVNSIAGYCRTRFPERTDQNTQPLQPIPSEPTTPDLNDLFAATDRNPVTGEMPNEGSPDLTDLITGVDREPADLGPVDPGPNDPEPGDTQPTGQPGNLDGVYHLAQVESAVGPRTALPMLLRWRTIDAQRAAATLEISPQASPEIRSQMVQLGIPARMQLTAKKQDGVYLINDPKFRTVSQKVLTGFAKLGDAIGSAIAGVASLGAAGGGSTDSIEVHSAIVRVSPGPANHLRIDFHFDYTVSSSSGRKRQSNRTTCIGLRR